AASPLTIPTNTAKKTKKLRLEIFCILHRFMRLTNRLISANVLRSIMCNISSLYPIKKTKVRKSKGIHPPGLTHNNDKNSLLYSHFVGFLLKRNGSIASIEGVSL